MAFYGVRVHKCNGVRTQAPRFALQRSGYRCVVHKLLTVNILRESRVSVCFSISIFVFFFLSFRIFLPRLWHCYRPPDHRGYLTYRASSITNAENTSFPRHDLNQLRESVSEDDTSSRFLNGASRNDFEAQRYQSLFVVIRWNRGNEDVSVQGAPFSHPREVKSRCEAVVIACRCRKNLVTVQRYQLAFVRTASVSVPSR